MTREDFIMSLAENITMVTILCIVAGLLIGWYVTQSYYKWHETSEDLAVDPPELPSLPSPEKRYRQSWQFINLANAGDNQTLNRTVCMMSRNGYDFQPDASNAGVLAFMKLKEAPEATGPNELTDADIERLRKQAEEIRKEYESKKSKEL
jgi:hypothetical protein